MTEPAHSPSQHILLLQALDQSPRRVAELVQALPAEAHDWKLKPDEWDVAQIVAHLTAAQPLFRTRLTRILENDNPWLPRFGPETALPDSPEPLHALLARFRAERDRILRFLSGLDPDDWDRPAIHQTMGATTLALQVQSILNHDNEHLGQMGNLCQAWSDWNSEGRRTQTAQPKANRVPGGLGGGQYQPLTQEQVKKIYQAALTILEETGIQVMPSACREVWHKAGARIDADRNRVFVPRALVEQALRTAAHQVRLCGQAPEHDLQLGGARVYMGTGGAAINVLYLDGRVRASRLQDVYDIGRMVNALDNIHFYLRPCVARDIPIEFLDVNSYYACLTATTKHVMGNCFTPESVRQVMRLASMIAGSEAILRERPFVSWITCWTVSPLRYAPETVEVLDEVVRQGMPVVISSAPQAGATSPAALAGTLAQITAEELSGVTYINLLRPGHPVILGYVPSVADLLTGSFTGGSPEFALMNAAAAQICQYLRLPVYNSSGLTDSKIPDVQTGYEKGISSVTAALAGANYIHHSAGMLESMLTVAYEQFVIDDDINGAVMRMVRGIEVNDKTLSVDVIHQICSGEGHFWGHPQTLELMKHEYYYAHTGDRRTRADWESAGAQDMCARAQARACKLLETQWPQHISAELDARIRAEFDILLPRRLMERTGDSSRSNDSTKPTGVYPEERRVG